LSGLPPANPTAAAVTKVRRASGKERRIFMKKLEPSFFRKDAITLARALIGTILVHRIRGREYRARIVETEAYLGPHDLASHSSKGRTKRTEIMFGPAGHAYVYLIYGMYDMFNIVAGKTGDAQAVLIRAAEPLDGWQANLSGPGRLTRSLGITRSRNGMDLYGDKLFLLGDPRNKLRIGKSKRIGVDYAKEWKDKLLQFYDADSSAVSKSR
jgi:DNA-3-methyladenine glycosylase